MRIKKLEDTRLNIYDINDIYCDDYDKMLLRTLRERYNGVCYKSAYIVNVLRIVKRGRINFKNKSLDGTNYVDVRFEVDAIVYLQGDILHNCNIIKINESNKIVASNEHADIKINNISGADIFKEGDMVPVIVNHVRYHIYEKKMAIKATVFIPNPRSIIYYEIEDDVDINESKLLLDIKEVKTKIAEYNNKAVNFFTETIYPYKEYNNYKGLGKKMDIEKFNNMTAGDIIFIGERKLNEEHYYYVTNKEKVEEKIIISKYDLYNKLVFENYTNLCTLLEFLENYDSDKIKQNSLIWKFYKSMKL